MKQLDQSLRQKSHGQLGIRIFAGGIAGDELDVLRKIRIGQIHCSAFSGVGITQILPMLRVLDLPFLFRDQGEIDRVHKTFFDFFSKQFREKNFELLSWAEVGDVHLFSNKPIRRVADLSGLKIWAWSGDPIAKETFSVMGSSPIPLSITDVNTALNTGMIDTVYAPPLGALALQWTTQVKYMTTLPMAHATGVVLIAEDFFRKIPADLSQLLEIEFQRAMAKLTSELREQSQDAIRIIQHSGITLVPPPSQSDLLDFYKVHDQVAKNLSGTLYPRDLLLRVYEVLKRPGVSMRP